MRRRINVRRLKRKLKNMILKTVFSITGGVCLISACALDSKSWIPLIVCVITFLLLMLFAYANGLFGGYEQ